VFFVRSFERLYHVNKDPVRLKVCLINNHMILHLGKCLIFTGIGLTLIASQVRDISLMPTFWCFTIERYISVLKGKLSLVADIDIDVSNKAIIIKHLNHLPPYQ
jgi:hypothetical protein